MLFLIVMPCTLTVSSACADDAGGSEEEISADSGTFGVEYGEVRTTKYGVITVTSEAELQNAVNLNNNGGIAWAELSGDVVIASDIQLDFMLSFNKNSSMTIENCTVSCTYESPAKIGLSVESGCTLTIGEGATLSLLTDSYLLVQDSGTLNVNGSITGGKVFPSMKAEL